MNEMHENLVSRATSRNKPLVYPRSHCDNLDRAKPVSTYKFRHCKMHSTDPKTDFCQFQTSPALYQLLSVKTSQQTNQLCIFKR